MRETAVVCGLLVALGLTGVAAGAGTDETEFTGVLRTIEAAITAKDAEAALQALDPEQPALVQRTRASVKGWLALKDARVTYRLATLTGGGEEAEAVVFRRLTYEDHERPYVAARWETVGFRRTPQGWRIASEDERSYTRCRQTDLQVELMPEQGTIRGKARLSVDIVAGGEDSLLLDLNRGLAATSVEDGEGRPVHFDRGAQSIVISEPRLLRAGETRALAVTFEGKLFNESKEQGYSQVSVAPGGSFASWVTNWYPRLHGTGSKSRGRITYLAPAGITVASSGRLAGVEPVGGRERHVFEVDRPLDFSFAAAKYFHREATIDGTRLGVYLLRGGDVKADLYIREGARTLRYERTLYGDYPFDGYALVEIPSEETGDLGGSSEQGMNLFPVGVLPDAAFPLLLVAHEMGHSWWGNLVGSHDGPIVGEGLAQTTAVLCLREFQGEAAARRFLRVGVPEYRQSAAVYFARFAAPTGKDYPLGLPAAGMDAMAAAHDLADTKGMLVYDMLRQRIGPDAFLRGLRAIIADFAGRTVGVSDLRTAWEKASGQDLQRFFEQWFHRTGAPDLVLTASTAAADGGFVTSGAIAQTGEPYDVEAEVVLASPGTRRVTIVPVSGASTSFSVPTDFRPAWVVLDPEYKILRWTSAFRNYRLLADGLGLSSTGRMPEAVRKLEEYVAKVPESLEGRFRLGVAYEGSGRLDEAERCFREVIDRYHGLDVYEPAVSLSLLDLGHVLDLRGRRDEAKATYRQCLSMPDESGSHREAQAGLDAPYQPPAKAAGRVR